jgi:hypothetical protein
MMITSKAWNDYTSRLAKINKKAAELMQKWIDANGYDDFDNMVEYAYALTSKYGSAAATLACEMYEATAEAQGIFVAAAVPAETATINEVKHLIGEAAAKSPVLISPTVGKMVKQAGADTTLQNAGRDGAEWAWIPHGGETCAYCIILASRGWQKASADMVSHHAEHIHPNCQCEFAIRWNKKSGVSGYDPETYKRKYYNAGAAGPDRINILRRALREENKDQINAQKRAAYAERRERENGEKEET